MKWIIFLLAFGCVGQGTGNVTGDVHVKACNQRNDFNADRYSMDPEFFVGEPIEDINQNGYPRNRLEIRVQATSANLGGVVTSLDNGAGVDTLFVSISDVRGVAALVGQPIMLNPIDIFYMSNPPPVRIALGMLGTCPFSPNNTLAADMPSTIMFTAFGSATAGQNPAADFKVDFGDHIHAEFDLVLVDLRAKLNRVGTPQASGHVNGFFDFDLRRGAAGQTFP